MRPTATTSVREWRATDLDHLAGVASRDELASVGVSKSTVTAHVRAGRWQRLGRAIVLHNGTVSRSERERAYLYVLRRAQRAHVLHRAGGVGLRGWERDKVHVLVPAGTRDPRLPGLVLHRVVEWDTAGIAAARRLHHVAPALLLAAASIPKPRIACAILASAVQQRLVRPGAIHAALDQQPKLRHHHAIRLAMHDIAQGSHALSEIDFVRLCRRHGLPEPNRQGIRREPSGRQRYLDADWLLRNGRIVAAEVDGAIHIEPEVWADDQLRQNEIVIATVPVLRFPTVVIRTEEAVVADQLRRAFAAYQ
jgi:hypothetical protein